MSSITVIPFTYSLEDCDPRYDLLNQVNLIFGKGRVNLNVPPMLKFIGLLKEKFCTACGLVSVNEDVNSHGNSSTIYAIMENLKVLKESQACCDQDYITGYNAANQETFFALLLPEQVSIDAGTDSFALIMLRRRNMFTAEDVIVVRACVNLFFNRFRENYTDEEVATSTISSKKLMTTSEVITKASYQMGGQISTNEISHLYGEALNLVCKCVVITESDGTLIHMNTMAETLFKRTFQGEESVARLSGGISWLAGLIHPDDLTLLVNNWNSAHETNNEFVADFRLLTLNNVDYHLFRCRAKPIKNGTNDTVHYWIFCMYDMELSRLMEETKLAAVRKTKFLAEMSHEIRTPLACVIGTCSLLRYTPLSKEQNELLNTIRVCSQQLFTLTNNILDLSKIEESKLELESRPVNLERALTDVIDIFVPDLVKKDIDVALNISYPEVPELVMSDEGRLRQVFTNVLSNAIKFTKEHSTVSIQVRKEKDECGLGVEGSLNAVPCLKFEFTDEGPGIPDTVPQSQLFDTFVQLDSSTFRKFGGSGLGLTISKKLVNLLGGDIWYESTVGQGTNMIFTIRLKQITPLELSNTPTAECYELPSSYRYIFSLKEFLNTFQAQGVVSVLVAMRRAKLNEYVLKTFQKIDLINTVQMDQNIPLSNENELIYEIIKSQPTILITDLAEFIPEFKKAAVDGLLKAVIMLTSETDTQCIEDGNRFRCLRKPVKPAILIKTAHEVFLSILSKRVPQIESESKIESSVQQSLIRSKWFGDEDSHTTPAKTVTSASAFESKREAIGGATLGSQEAMESGEKSAVTFGSKYPLKIMLAEDNLLNQQLMTRTLAKYGYNNVIVVDNGRKALDAFCRLFQQGGDPIEAIVMDMQMPEVEGPEATELIRTFCRQTGCPQPHIMALTAKAFSEDKADCLRAGMCTYLSKPVRWSTLEEELIQAHGATNDTFKCSCNENRILLMSENNNFAAEASSSSYEKNSYFSSSSVNGNGTPCIEVAKSTGLDV